MTVDLELLVFLEDGREVRHPLKTEVLDVGRRPQLGLSLDDEFLSRSHCRFSLKGGRLMVEDLGSYNGTYVNGQKIHESCFVAPGDVVKIGHCRVFISRPGETDELRVHAPDLSPDTGVEPIAKAKPPTLAAPYSSVEEISDEVRRKRERPPLRPGKTRKARALPEPSPLPDDLPASVSGTMRYVAPETSADETEDPTPIPDPNFTASAIMRGDEVTTPEDQERRGLRVIAQLARVLHSAEDLGDFLDFATGRLLEVIPAERGLLLRLDRKKRGLYVESCRSAIPTRDDREARRLGISHTIAKRVVRDRVSVLVNDAVIDDRFREASSIQSLQVRSVLCTPIWHRQKVSGLIYLDHAMHAYAFTEADREFLVAVANLLSLGLDTRRR